MNLRNTFFGIILLSLIASCGGDDPFFFEDDFSTVPEAFSVEGITPDTTQTGLIIYEIALGSGDLEVGIRDDVEVFYTGRTTDKEIFDSSYKNSSDDPLRSSVRGFVDGFTEGLIGMKEGGKRVLVIPPSLAYEGTSNALRNDTLVFDVEIDTIIF
ncbi:MAG: FKBP-type peptidyl-prolyl cis-trans isomerase [Balneola sp.]|nr:FKBP-type peptidyl-prolyl cis-trans isomerase [Balneola sp.]MBO6650375.1 FKBP-type peptidyl-prolyl cis-trans isomerase [Balneola sp.]MBO6710228.1 FKBP-type peptidyl-prolyl cis-trans isomerase [Balneola sp.]MBO6798913.1 FKBP-type peptidyl-prolyl cis-trans isomerase [Balneola sp.]MBO6870027.1 FKBP-type peptidyl-prolyl cis-trans isomerase [Balneola sp.]